MSWFGAIFPKIGLDLKGVLWPDAPGRNAGACWDVGGGGGGDGGAMMVCRISDCGVRKRGTQSSGRRLQTSTCCTKGRTMEKVTGIGGFFFRSSDPKKLAKWYADNLGVNLTPTAYSKHPWTQEAGP